jgi:signal transduction histidine kinase
MRRTTSAPGARVIDLVYCGIALVAAVLTVIGEQFHPWVIAAVVVALVPWALVVARVPLGNVAFASLAIIPLIPVIVCTGIGSGIFLTLAAASRLASRSDQRWLVGIVTAVVIVLPFTAFLFGFDEWDVGAVYFAFGGAFSVLVGVLLRRSTRLAEELRLADAELADAAVREERHRIARDVHDLIAHSLTVVVLHVGGARRVIRTDPAAAEAALTEAERVSRESLDAIRGVVGLLREDDEPEVLSLDLERLVTTYRSAGLAVSATIEGTTESLPLAVRVTLYRVVQEALANAARHSAPATPVSVVIAIDEERMVARIENERADDEDGLADAAGGFGLVGLREQTVALGGELASGPEGSRWVVECRLPIGGAA